MELRPAVKSFIERHNELLDTDLSKFIAKIEDEIDNIDDLRNLYYTLRAADIELPVRHLLEDAGLDRIQEFDPCEDYTDQVVAFFEKYRVAEYNVPVSTLHSFMLTVEQELPRGASIERSGDGSDMITGIEYSVGYDGNVFYGVICIYGGNSSAILKLPYIDLAWNDQSILGVVPYYLVGVNEDAMRNLLLSELGELVSDWVTLWRVYR